MSVGFDFNASPNDVAPTSPMLLPVDLMRIKSGMMVDAFHLFLLSSPFRKSFVIAVFDFSASLNDFAPVSPMLFSDELMRMEKSVSLMDVICVLLLLSSPFRLSSVSVVFDFSASPNDVAPVSPISFTVF